MGWLEKGMFCRFLKSRLGLRRFFESGDVQLESFTLSGGLRELRSLNSISRMFLAAGGGERKILNWYSLSLSYAVHVKCQGILWLKSSRWGFFKHTSAMDCDYLNEDGLEAFPPRGWSMKRGHRKALEARTVRKSLGCTLELSLATSGLGRSAVKRSVNRSRRFEKELTKSRRLQSRQLQEAVLDACQEHRQMQEDQKTICFEPTGSLHLEAYFYFDSMGHHEPFPDKNQESSKELDESEVASLCSSTTAGSESGSDISMHLQIQSCRSPWEAAIMQASIVAACHYKKNMKEEAARKREKQRRRSPEEKYLDELSQKYTVDISYGLKVARCDKFERFRSEFFHSHVHCFLRQLQHLYLCHYSRWNLRATPVSQWVRQKFLDTLESESEGSEGGKLVMAFHGTGQHALQSIYKDGLLVPGLDNVIRVANGSAYGCGIYAARSECASTSWGYSRGNTQPILICAALDGPKGIVYHGSNFLVFFQNHRVVPLFEASVAEYQPRIPAPVPAPTPPVISIKPRVADPWKKPKGPGPRTRSFASKVPDVKAFLSRRAACKRRGTSCNG